MDCIDLGQDNFIVKFERQEDLGFVLKGGPQFVGATLSSNQAMGARL